ncbi:MAG: pyridoxal-phosphate dependent enzyme, partial [Proteobacteria bacterium]|nr:pyridoxal-phosphate dependent enzyme [Pseudomonadota bacterium]
GADTMYRSFKSGRAETIAEIKTIADSLGAPMSLPLGVAICRKNLEGIIRIQDDEMIAAMKVLAEDMKLMVEPAGAAALAALMGPLNKRLKNKRVGILICGSNISGEDFCRIAG